MRNEMLIYAKHFYNMGLNVTCITNYLTEFNIAEKNLTKSPYHRWDHLKKERQTLEELLSYDWDNATGVGIVLGFNKVRAIDIDGCSDNSLLNKVLEILKLPYDYEWAVKSGSHNGYHILVKTDWGTAYSHEDWVNAFGANEEYKYILEKIEFRWTEHIVLPPSIHKSTYKYKFINTILPKEEPTEINVFRIKNVVNTFLDTTIEISNKSGAIETAKNTAIVNSVNLSVKKIAELAGMPLYLVIDVETDGLPKINYNDLIKITKWPNIVQIAWALLDKNGKIYKKECETIFRKEINEIEYANIDYAKAKLIGKNIREVMEKFLEDVNVATHIVGHNIDFDSNVINAELQKLGFRNKLKDLKSICTMKESTIHCAIPDDFFGFKYPKLEELYFKLFDSEILNSHNALSDVLATSKCFVMLKKLNVIK